MVAAGAVAAAWPLRVPAGIRDHGPGTIRAVRRACGKTSVTPALESGVPCTCWATVVELPSGSMVVLYPTLSDATSAEAHRPCSSTAVFKMTEAS